MVGCGVLSNRNYYRLVRVLVGLAGQVGWYGLRRVVASFYFVVAE